MSQKTQHTPGPWKFFKDTRFGPWNTAENKQGNPHYYQWWIESDSRKCMALLEVPYLNTDPKWRKDHPQVIAEHAKTLKEVEANAALIAAAPELLEACNLFLAYHDNQTPDAVTLEHVEMSIRAAIAKAGGAQ